MSRYTFLTIVFAAFAGATLSSSNASSSYCLHIPGDPEWPSEQSWSTLNSTVDGRLIQIQPIAKSCHGADFDETTCGQVKQEWTEIPLHIADPASVCAPYWQNNSCSPFTPESQTCELGNLAVYAINVSSASDVQAGVQFAKSSNIRLSVKNTGHDYNGKSAGEGSLGLWMHNLKDISVVQYNSSFYSGKALKISAGAQAFEVYTFAAAHGLRAVGGFCPTVGLSGGYFQGAGHGPLASLYGLAADNTLEVEVVTTEGEHLIVSPTQNADLYWALNGGGGGTYAVVLSYTTRAHPDGPVGGATLTFNNTDDNAYWSAIEYWYSYSLQLDELYGFSSVSSFSNASFSINFATWPGASANNVSNALEPFLAEIRTNGLEVAVQTTQSPNFLDHYSSHTPGFPEGIFTTTDVIGGRLLSRSAVQQNNSDLVTLYRNVAERGFQVNTMFYNVTFARIGSSPDQNSVLPAWRDSVGWLNVVASWDPQSSIASLDETLDQIREIEVQLVNLTPGSGAYMNEATFSYPDWKDAFYGKNYDRLLEVKKNYDPSLMLYGPAAVGSDLWQQQGDGRLCQVSS